MNGLDVGSAESCGPGLLILRHCGVRDHTEVCNNIPDPAATVTFLVPHGPHLLRPLEAGRAQSRNEERFR